MATIPKTRQSLILRLKNREDNSAWDEFVTIYRPVIFRLAVARGLQTSDADDLAQEVLLSVARSVPDWEADPGRARFRTWLSRIVRNAAINALSRRKADRGTGGTSAFMLISGVRSDQCDDSEVLELEWRREAFRRAADVVRDEFRADNWKAFWLTSVEGLGGAEAAERTGKTIGAVYAARSRIMARIRRRIQTMSGIENGARKDGN